MILRLFSIILFIITAILSVEGRERIDLSGKWHFRLPDVPDSLLSISVTEGDLNLPGTLDTNKVGIRVDKTANTDNLSRRYTYTGRAVYSRYVDIKPSAEGKLVILNLERTRPSSVKVDGIDAGSRSQISATQEYDLTEFFTPGRHLLEITVDNGESIPPAVRNSSHACTDATQTNWNGIIGDISLELKNPVHISSSRILPDVDRKSFIVSGMIARSGVWNGTKEPRNLKVAVSSGDVSKSLTLSPESPDEFSLTLNMGQSARLWSEWDPYLYDISLTVTDADGNVLDTLTKKSGLRNFSTSGTHFTINGVPTFLRGRHDACVWPLTGHVPMDRESWDEYFRRIKEYGINHVRFHSWCPPEACFAAADEAGVYLQPELSIWGEIDKDQVPLLEFLQTDMENIVAQYGDHPSFVMFSVGNELWGDTSIMKDLIDSAREKHPGLLATYGSNIYLGYQGHIEGEDFLVTCRVGNGDGYTTHARASFSFADAENGGIMNSVYPNTTMDFSKAINKSPVPIVGHETGQYQSYPDFSTINKYKGVLRPDNLTEFRRRAEKEGTLRKNNRYAKASGEWAARLYKADMEMNLRTPGMGGFQLLDLQDYPGQGTALVGILDPFLDSKGFITPEKWRESCDAITVLAELPRFTYTGGEELTFKIVVANYSDKDIDGDEIRYQLPFISGEKPSIGGKGVVEQTEVTARLPKVKTPQKMELKLSLLADGIDETVGGAGNVVATNNYDIWVYPEITPKVKGVNVTTDFNEAIRLLEQGKRVILAPDSVSVAATTLDPLFQTDYWNYRMFLTICQNVGATPSPGTLGLLINDTHPLFETFPTESHTNWQWFDIIRNSRPLIIDRLPATVDPIVEPIDNVERNYRLAMMLECNVGKGRLLIVMTDLDRISATPEGRWFRYSLERYVASKRFKPSLNLTPKQLTNLLTHPSMERTLKELKNISY